MFRIKICGLTNADEAVATCRAGADAIGLNFFADSVRFVDDRVAAEIVAEVRQIGAPDFVGVFVNEPLDQIRSRIAALQLDWIQLHGDETPEQLAQAVGCSDARVIRAFRCDDRGLAPVLAYLDECVTSGCMPHAILLDAAHTGMFGGTGKTLDWELLAKSLSQLPSSLPWVLAGGLTDQNVEHAIRQLRPSAVDTASGVESMPGRKDAQRVVAFTRAANRAFG